MLADTYISYFSLKHREPILPQRAVNAALLISAPLEAAPERMTSCSRDFRQGSFVSKPDKYGVNHFKWQPRQHNFRKYFKIIFFKFGYSLSSRTYTVWLRQYSSCIPVTTMCWMMKWFHGYICLYRPLMRASQKAVR